MASIADNERTLGWLMLSPALAYVIGFVGVPFVLATLLAFSNATVGNPTLHHFVGLADFAGAVRDPQFRIALRNSVIITFSTLAILIVLATVEAELLAHSFRGKRVVQILLILPWAIPVSLAAVAWLWLLDSEFSPIDWIFRQIGVLGPGGLFGPAWHFYYLGRTDLALASVVVINVWRMLPLATIIVLAGRLSIPRDLFEQAEVDGAGRLRVLFRITIPALVPVLVVAVLFTALLVFGDMAVVDLTTRGGPGESSMVLPYWAYLKGITGGDLGGGAAVALFMLPVLLAVSYGALRFAYRSRE
ncbi:MAG TPA: sugar ABC transporter permease [Casimicrobiaceae bacterium]|nr:sugar ABC transporter permease [Casimicrobiaceae bacterium]